MSIYYKYIFVKYIKQATFQEDFNFANDIHRLYIKRLAFLSTSIYLFQYPYYLILFNSSKAIVYIISHANQRYC